MPMFRLANLSPEKLLNRILLNIFPHLACVNFLFRDVTLRNLNLLPIFFLLKINRL